MAKVSKAIRESRGFAEGIDTAAVHRRCVKAAAKARKILYDAAAPFVGSDGSAERALDETLEGINRFEKAMDEVREYLDQPPGTE